MKSSICLIKAVLAALALSVIAQAQPIFQSPSGCKEAAVLTTEQALNPGSGSFAQDHTVIPGEETTVVLGAWLVVAFFTPDPAAGTPGCPTSPDGHPLYVTKLSLRPVSGDPIRAGIKTITFWMDNDLDGFFSPGKDTQVGAPLPGSCLTATAGCELSFGNTPIFGGLGGLADPPFGFCLGTLPMGGGGCGGIIAVAELENPQPGATLQVRLEGQASDITNNPIDPRSSDFSPARKKTASNIRVRVEGTPGGAPPSGGTSGLLSPSVNNGSGNSETGVVGVKVTGIRTRDDRGGLSGTAERDARPGDREYFVGIVGICEGGTPIPPGEVAILPAVAGASPTIAGGLGAIPCVPNTPVGDGKPTNIVRIRVGVSGPGAQYVQAIHLYGDVDVDGTIFEGNELMLTAIPINGIAALGSLEQILVFPNGVMAAIPDHAPLPRLLYVTLDIDDRAQPSSVRVQVAVDVAELIGFPSSRLMNTTPVEFNFQISGAAQPPSGPTPGLGGLAQFDSNGNCTIDDPELFNAIDAWIAGQVSNDLFFQAVDAWISQSNVCVGSSALKLEVVGVKSSGRGVIFRARGQGITSLGVEVFDLSGERVFAQEAQGTTLRWNLITADGRTLANGVYLYVVTVKGQDGQLLQNKVRKLVVLR